MAAGHLERERQAAKPEVVWRLEHFQDDANLLTNVGRTIAYDVRSELGDHMLEGATVAPGGSTKCVATPTRATRDDTATVTWIDKSHPLRRNWNRPLPPALDHRGGSRAGGLPQVPMSGGRLFDRGHPGL